MRVGERNASLAGAAVGLVVAGASWAATAAALGVSPFDVVALHVGAPALLVVDTLPVVLGWCGLLWVRATFGMRDADLGLVADILPDAAILVDASGRVRARNSSAVALLGDPLGRRLDEVMPPASQREAEPLETALDGHTRRVEWARTIVSADGSARSVRVSWGPAPGRSVLLVLRPIPAEPPRRRRSVDDDGAVRRLEAELAEARDALHARWSTLAEVSRDLRDQLSAIVGYAELLAEEQQGDPEGRSTADTVVLAGRHVLDRVDAILDLAKLGDGTLAIDAVPVPVQPLLEEVEALARPLVRHHTLVVEADADVGLLRGDRFRVRQVLLQLVSVACSPTAPRAVVLHASNDGRRVTFRLRDPADATPRGNLEAMFDDAHAQRGTGLVLARRLAEAMGGALLADGGLGVGTTFTLTLPALASSHTLMPLPTLFHEVDIEPVPAVVVVALSAERGATATLRRELGQRGYEVLAVGVDEVESACRRPHVIAAVMEAAGPQVPSVPAVRVAADAPVSGAGLEGPLRAALRSAWGVVVDVEEPGLRERVTACVEGGGWRLVDDGPLRVTDRLPAARGAVWMGADAPGEALLGVIPSDDLAADLDEALGLAVDRRLRARG